MNDRDSRDRLVDSILERTSRSPCERTQQRLCELVDGTLDGAGARRVRRHLRGCRECRSLAAALTALSEDLPAAALPWQERLTRGWERMVRGWADFLQRPRFTLEAAYVGTMALAVLFISPFSPLRGVSAQTLTAVRIDPTAALSNLTGPVATRSSRVGDFGRQAWETIGAETRDSYRGLEAELANRHRRVGEAAQDLSRHGAELRDAALDLDLDETSGALNRMTTDLGSIWQRIISGHPEETNDEAERAFNTEPRRPS
ncbi:MAG: hypothetical protein GY856_04335 [bacterium]|nr:hypothetical protein [bacterium]